MAESVTSKQFVLGMIGVVVTITLTFFGFFNSLHQSMNTLNQNQGRLTERMDKFYNEFSDQKAALAALTARVNALDDSVKHSQASFDRTLDQFTQTMSATRKQMDDFRNWADDLKKGQEKDRETARRTMGEMLAQMTNIAEQVARQYASLNRNEKQLEETSKRVLVLKPCLLGIVDTMLEMTQGWSGQGGGKTRDKLKTLRAEIDGIS